MTEYSYSEMFWFVALLITVLGLFWLAVQDDPEDDGPSPDPTHDTTKTRVIE